MNSITKHSAKLFKSALKVAERNNLNVVPYPETAFRNNKEFYNYLDNLTNFISYPELFYMSKKSIPSTKIFRSIKLPKKYFENLV